MAALVDLSVMLTFTSPDAASLHALMAVSLLHRYASKSSVLSFVSGAAVFLSAFASFAGVPKLPDCPELPPLNSVPENVLDTWAVLVSIVGAADVTSTAE